MSTEYYFYCAKHHTDVWIGSVNISGIFLFPDDVIASVRAFMRAHLLCSVDTVDENDIRLDGSEDYPYYERLKN